MSHVMYGKNVLTESALQQNPVRLGVTDDVFLVSNSFHFHNSFNANIEIIQTHLAHHFQPLIGDDSWRIYHTQIL